MKYKFTEKGRKYAENYLANLMAKRKEILDAGLDTVDEVDCANLTIDNLLEDAVDQGFDQDGEAYNNFYVTDNYDSDGPYCFILGEDVVKVPETERELYDAIKQDYLSSDDELCSEFFTSYVSENLTEGDILSAYIALQYDINGDFVLRLKPETVKIVNSLISADVLDFNKEDYNKVYQGNVADFLKYFNDKEKETGFCRIDGNILIDETIENAELYDFIF